METWPLPLYLLNQPLPALNSSSATFTSLSLHRIEKCDPGLGRSLGEENGNPLWYSCLENPMDRGAWRATVHGVTKSRTRLSDKHFHFFTFTQSPSSRAETQIQDSLLSVGQSLGLLETALTLGILFFQLEYNCFTMLCYFLLYNNVNHQAYL